MNTPHTGAKPNWLNDSIMNLLVDYYTEVQFRPYGSAATRENVLPVLRELALGYLCIYAKGHSGCTSWPSSLNTRHTMLAQDVPRFFREVTRETGTRLVLYYSGLLDGIAGIRHPDWRMQHPDGSPKEFFSDFKIFISYGNCPLSGYFDEWVAVQLRELIENYEPDGIWVDGDWPGPCYCPRCRERFRSESRWTGPWDEIRTRPAFDAAYQKTWNRIEHEWRMRFRNFIKSLKPDCLYSAGNVSPRREFLQPFDWRSGDFFSPGFFNLHDVARMMRWYGTLGVPYDAYVCDTSFTHARKHVRSRSKTLDRMLQEAATVAASGGAVGYWTYPTADGALVPSRMKKAAAVRRFLADREDVFLHTESLRWTAILASDPATPTFGGPGVEGAHKALAALHRSPDVIDETGVTADVPWDLLVLPEQAFVDAGTVQALARFVERGGKLLTSGQSINSPELRDLMGVRLVRSAAISDGHVLLKTHDEPAGIDSAWDRLELIGRAGDSNSLEDSGVGSPPLHSGPHVPLGPPLKTMHGGCRGGRRPLRSHASSSSQSPALPGTSRPAVELYPLYLSWDQFNPECRNLPNNWPMHGQLDEQHPQPAGFPAAIARRLGNGIAVHVCTGVFARYRTLGDPQMLRWLREIIDFMQPEPLFRTDAPSWVDVSLRRKEGRLLIHLVNQNPGRDISRLSTDDTWVDEIPAIGPITSWIRLPRRPASVAWQPGGSPADAEWNDGVLRIVLPRLEIHACMEASM